MTHVQIQHLERRMARIRSKLAKLGNEFHRLMKLPKSKQVEKSFSKKIETISKKLKGLSDRHSQLHRRRWKL